LWEWQLLADCWECLWADQKVLQMVEQWVDLKVESTAHYLVGWKDDLWGFQMERMSGSHLETQKASS
jgi:hypothetical protein